ncbi:MAG: GGDEF domain-containing protein [Rhizobiaceae bacterium]|nr:GGDEF domain-containing protein [Rhizobiaceae bacterium]
MSILLKSGLVAAASIIASIAISALIVPGDDFILVDGWALAMCILCPLVIAWPASAYTFWQKSKLTDALTALKGAHADLAAAHARLAEKARRDDMTGMLNREAFFDEMDCARRAFGRGTLLIVDADNFKQVNDNWGHLTGDAALLEICDAIKRAVRSDDIVGRIGGEEFAVYLTDADHRESMIAAERIRTEVASIAFSPRGGERLALSVSIGGAMNRAAAQLADLMREADRRLYEAKRRGRNRVIFSGYGVAA